MSPPSVSQNKHFIKFPLLILLCILICGYSNSNSLTSTDPDSIGTESSNTVTTIEYQAFSNCPNQKNLIIPDSFVTIGINAFPDN